MNAKLYYGGLAIVAAAVAYEFLTAFKARSTTVPQSTSLPPVPSSPDGLLIVGSTYNNRPLGDMGLSGLFIDRRYPGLVLRAIPTGYRWERATWTIVNDTEGTVNGERVELV